MAWFKCVGGDNMETASVYRWVYNYNVTTCWGEMKKFSGDVIGQNGDSTTSDITLDGDLMTVLFHGTNQTITVTAKVNLTLKAYSTNTSKTMATITPTVYTMSANDTQSFTPDDLYGGLYLEATK